MRIFTFNRWASPGAAGRAWPRQAVKKVLPLLFLLPAAEAWAQRGIDGTRTIASGTAIVNEYTKVTDDAAAGSTQLRVTSNGLNTNNRFGRALSPGDLVMVIQMQGATINSTDAAAYGSVTAYNNAGRYEVVEVASVSSTNIINLTCGLKNSYSTAGQTQVVRLPSFNTLTVNSGATVSGQTWDRTTGLGGVIAMEVINGTTINGTINATGLGFKGGVADNSSDVAGVVVTGYRGTAAEYGAEKGESIAGFQADYDALSGRYGRGAAANGGGGGNSHNAAGGGGANVGIGAWTGTGNPDRGTSNGFDAAWNLESPGFATSVSSGGGRGGYSYASANQDALTVGPGVTSWGGNNRQNIGGLGGRPLDSRGRIYLGGGGGAGDGNNGVSTSGGNGGGVVYMLTGGAVGGSGTIQANGATGTRGNILTSGGTDAAGGGGGGGTIVLHVSGTITGITASAQGGTGGSQRDAGVESEGPGGGGGGGLIMSTSTPSNTLVTQVQGGVNGTTSSTALTEFTPNGATRGGAGLTQTILYNAQCAVADVTTALTPLSNPTPAGQPGGFTVSFSNTGPSGANEVIGQVKLPANLSILSISNGGVYNAQTGFVDYPNLTTLTSGQVFESIIRFVTPPVSSVAAYSYVYTTTGQGSNTNPDVAYETFNVTPVADVTTTITGPTVLGQGQASGTYTVNFTNNGPSTASNVAQSIVLPAGTTNVSAPGAQSIVTNGNNTVTVTYPPAATLNSGTTNSFQLSFTAPATSGSVNLISSTGTSTSQGANAAADQFTFAATVTNVNADLTTTVTPTSSGILAGQEGSFTIKFTNNGPSTATGIVAKVQLPAGQALTDTGGGSYDQASGVLTFTNLTTLNANASFSPVIKFIGGATGGTVTAASSVSSSAFDTNTANNTANGSITVTPTADVVTTVSGPATAAAGSQVTYTATVRNNGPSTAANVNPVLQLPKALLAVTLPTGASYNANTGEVTFPAISSLTNGASQDYSVTFTLPNNNQPVSGQGKNTADTNDAAAPNNNGTQPAANVTTTVSLPAGTCSGSTFNGQTATQGLYAEYFKGYFNDNFAFFNAAPNLTRTIANVTYNARNEWGDITTAINSGTATDPDNYSSRMRGYITIVTGGTYTFSLYSDDAAWLWVGNNARDASLQASKAVVDARGAHSARFFTGTISLAAGTYPVQLLYGEAGGDNVLLFYYNGPDTGGNNQLVPSSVLCSTQFSGPLPVELNQFTAVASELDAQLTWSTSQEKNSAYFAVERSVAGQPFVAIGQVDSRGTTNQVQRYSFLDAGVARLGATVYYRLKQVDQDGTFSYSPVRTVGFEKLTAQFTVVPNPVTTLLKVHYTETTESATATVYSVLGQPLLRQALNASGDAELDVRQLPAGSYVVRVLTTKGSSRSFRFVKQ